MVAEALHLGVRQDQVNNVVLSAYAPVVAKFGSYGLIVMLNTTKNLFYLEHTNLLYGLRRLRVGFGTDNAINQRV